MVANSPAQWHAQRRNEMKHSYPELSQIPTWTPWTGVIMLLNSTATVCCAYWSRHWPLWAIVPFCMTAGQQLHILRFCCAHECAHGTTFPKWLKGRAMQRCFYLLNYLGSPYIAWFWYYRFGHLSHHSLLGMQSTSEARNAPAGYDADIGNGTVMDRLMQLNIQTVQTASDKELSTPGLMKPGGLADSVPGKVLLSVLGCLAYAVYLAMEVPATLLTGFKHRFPNKPESFYNEMRWNQALQALVASAICACASWDGAWWKPLLVMILPEAVIWTPYLGYIALGAFHDTHEEDQAAPCQPTISFYIPILNFLMMNLTHHCEHHDMPEVPWLYLPTLRRIAQKTHYQQLRSATSLKDLVTRDKTKHVYGCHQRHTSAFKDLPFAATVVAMVSKNS